MFVNEILFFLHILLVIGFLLLSLRLGKGALLVFITLQGVLANLFVVKQMDLFGFTVTCSDVFIIGIMLGLNFMREIFGKEAAKLTIKLTFLSLAFFMVMAQMHLFYRPSSADHANAAYKTVLENIPRIVIASAGVFLIVMLVDVYLYGLFMEKKKSLFSKMGGAIAISQILDTILFSFAGLYGIVANIWDVILVSGSVKLIIVGISSSFVAFAGKRLAKHEEI